uniref:Membrane protein n=1 Tax=Magnetospirillum gryphiswaldense TaxID=55518 RepID=A4TU61_9PROT|nr:membrane protein [Magnetospirillum gryphiswaldense MSR-1]
MVGVIFNLALWFALHVAFARFDGNWPVWGSAQPLQLALAAGAMIAMLRFKLGMLPVLGVCAAVGAVASLV